MISRRLRFRALLVTNLMMATVVASAARGDVVILVNGDRIEGQVVSDTPLEVSVRRRFRNSEILYVQKYSRDMVARVERGPVESQPQNGMPSENATLSTQPAGGLDSGAIDKDMVDKWKAGQPVGPVSRIADKPLFLRRAVEKWKDGQGVATAGDLTRLLTTTPAAELDALSPECEKLTGVSLAQFAADVHWRVARDRSRTGPVRLTGVAPYEIPAITRRLVVEYEIAIQSEVHPREQEPRARPRGPVRRPGVASRPALQAPPASEPAPELPANVPEGALTIDSWLDHPNELDVTRAEAAALTERIVYASSLLNERVRLDPAVRRDPILQKTLVGQRIRLLALLRASSDRMASGSNREAATPRRQAQDPRAEQLRQLEAMERMVDQEQKLLVQKALRMAQIEAQAAREAGPAASAPAGGLLMPESP